MSASTVANSLSAVCRRVSGRFLKSRASIRSSGSFRTPRRRARVAGCRVKTARDKVHHAGVRFQATGLSEHEPHAARIRKRLHRLCTTCAEKALISPNIRAAERETLPLLIPQDPPADQFAHRPFALAWHVEFADHA